MAVHKKTVEMHCKAPDGVTSKFTAGISEPLNQALFQPTDMTRADPAGVVINPSNKASPHRSLSNII